MLDILYAKDCKYKFISYIYIGTRININNENKSRLIAIN